MTSSNYVISEEICLHISKDRWAEFAGLQANLQESFCMQLIPQQTVTELSW